MIDTDGSSITAWYSILVSLSYAFLHSFARSDYRSSTSCGIAQPGRSEPTSEEVVRDRQERNAPGRIWHTAVAIDEAGSVGGYVSVVRHPWMPLNHFWVRTIDDPALRRRGAGELLYHYALDILRTQRATHVLSGVRDGCSAGLTFAQKHGFVVQRHLSVSCLPLAEFDPVPFAGVVEAVEATGIHFFSLP